MDEIQAGRLAKLAHFLRTEVRPDRFDTDSYVNLPNAEAVDTKIELTTKHKCGTTACALGWCGAIWPDRFSMVVSDNNGVVYPKLDDRVVSYASKYVADFFGLSPYDGGKEAEFLFGGDNDRTPTQEADVIEQFLKARGWFMDGETVSRTAPRTAPTAAPQKTLADVNVMLDTVRDLVLGNSPHCWRGVLIQVDQIKDALADIVKAQPEQEEKKRKKYEVVVMRSKLEQTRVTVEADSAAEANKLALSKASNHSDWEYVDPHDFEAFLLDPEKTKEVQ